MGSQREKCTDRRTTAPRERGPRTFAARWFAIVGLGAGIIVTAGPVASAQLYWNTSGTSATWTSAAWGTGPSGPFNSSWVSGTGVVFGGSAAASATFASATVGDITVNVDTTITQAGTLTAKSGGITVTVADGKTLTWTSQNWSATAGASTITKAGNGTWNIGAQGNQTTGTFTLNGGTVIVSGNLGLGGTNSSLVLQSGTINSTGTRVFTSNGGFTVAGNFGLAGTGNAQWTSNVALGAATRSINNDTASGSRQFVGVISGSAGTGLTFTGTGAGQAYVGNTGNTFSGPVTISGGEVVFNDNGSFGNTTSLTIDGGRLTMASMASNGNTSALTSGSIASSRNIFVGSGTGAISIQGATGNVTYNGVIADKPSSTGVLAKQGGGTLVLGGNNTYSGATLVNNGTIQLTGGNNRLPATTVLSLGQAASTNLGSLDLNGNSQQIAGLASVAGSNAGASTNVVTSAGAATLTINVASGTSTYSAGSATNSGVISGAISVVKNGAGAQVLGGGNSYSGSTTVNAGLLQINGSQTGNGAATVAGGELKVNGSLGTSTVTLNGGVLSGTGSVGAVTVNSGATVSPGNSPGTLTTGNLTFNGGGNYNWRLYDSNGQAGTGWDFISSTGALTISATSGSPFNVNLWTLSGTGPDVNGNALNFNPANSKTWTIGTFLGGITGTSDGWYTINTAATNGTGGFANSFAGGTFSLAASGPNLNLVYTAPVLTNYDYIGGGGNWSTGSNWTGGTAPSGSGLSVSFSGPGGTATNDGQLSSVVGITFTGSVSGPYVVAGSPLAIGGAGVVNNSSSMQTIQTVLTATAATVVNAAAGNLTLSGTLDNGGFGVTLLGTNGVTLADVPGAGSLSKIEGGAATLAGVVATNSISVSGGTLALGAANRLADAAAVSVSGSGTLDLGGFTDTVGGLTTSGNATLANGTLTAATYALGGGTVSANLGGGGTLTNTGNTALNGTAAAGTVNLNAGTLTLGSAGRLTGTPAVTGSSGASLVLGGDEAIASLAGAAAVTLGSATLTVGSDNANTTWSGTISGAGGLTKVGSGTLSLSAINPYTGPTTISAGVIAFSSASSGTFASGISGNGSVVKSGAGTLALTGTNTYGGGTTISNGILAVATAANLSTSGSIGVTGNGGLRFAGSDTFGTAGRQLVLSATQSVNPILNLTSGNTASFLGDVVLASGTNRIEPTSTAALTLAGSVTGAGAIQKQANGTLTFSGTGNTFSGGVILGVGRIVVAAGSGLGTGSVLINPTSSGTVTLQLEESVSVGGLASSTAGGGTALQSVTIAAGKTLTVTQATSGSFSGAISGAGGFVKQGAAALVMTGSNTTTGGITVSDGSLTFSGAKTFPTTGTVTVTNGGGILLDSNGTYGALGQALVLSATQSTNPAISITSNATPTFQGTITLASGVNRIEANGGTGVLTLLGNLSGAGTLLKAASGELVLSGSGGSSATGATQVGNGRITVNAGSALGTGDLTFAQTGNNNTRVDLKNTAQTIGTLATVWSATAQPSPTSITQRLDLNNGTTLTIAQSGTTTFGDYAGAPANVAGLGVITGSGAIVKAGAGSLTLSGSNSYSGGTTLTAGTLVAGNAGAFGTGAIAVTGGTLDLGSLAVGNAVTVSGGNLASALSFTGPTTIAGTVALPAAPNSAVTIAAGGVLQGTATVAALAGEGLVSPGNSPGILTAGSLDGSGGLDAAFEIAGFAPVYGLPAASVNDVLRLTGEAPFTGGGLGGGNTIDIYFASGAIGDGIYDAGFFTTLSAGDLLTAVQSANWVFWGQDAAGTRTFNGENYKPLLDFTGITAVTVTTAARTVDFGAGSVSGSITQFAVMAVPEPSTLALAAAGLAAAAWTARGRRRRSRRTRYPRANA